MLSSYLILGLQYDNISTVFHTKIPCAFFDSPLKLNIQVNRSALNFTTMTTLSDLWILKGSDDGV
jgi:hypothetical protein